MTAAQVVATGLAAPEGPVVHGDGRVTFVEQLRGQISLWSQGEVSVFALPGGGPNSHVAGSGGSVYVAQNGGVVDDWRSTDPRTPGIQRVRPDGVIEHLAAAAGTQRLMAPNDLVFGPDGALYLTDPAHAFDRDNRSDGRLVRFESTQDGPVGEVVVEVGPVYCNGLAFDINEELVWVESYERHVCRLDEDGKRVEICQLPESHTPDGLVIATDGRMFIATCHSHGITVLSPDGEVLDHLYLDDFAFPTNCAFDAAGALWVTDFGIDSAHWLGSGRLWRVPTDARGLPVVLGSLGA